MGIFNHIHSFKLFKTLLDLGHCAPLNYSLCFCQFLHNLNTNALGGSFFFIWIKVRTEKWTSPMLIRVPSNLHFSISYLARWICCSLLNPRTIFSFLLLSVLRPPCIIKPFGKLNFDNFFLEFWQWLELWQLLEVENPASNNESKFDQRVNGSEKKRQHLDNKKKWG